MNIRMGTEDRVAQPGCSQSELNTRKQPEQMVQATTLIEPIINVSNRVPTQL